jgi:hypothetical protein
VMQLRLAMLTDVVDTSLEASLPEIQRQFNELHSEVKTGNEKVCQKVDGLGAIFEASLESRPTRTELAGGFAEMAVRMAGGQGAVDVRRTTTATTAGVTVTEDSGVDWDRATIHTIQLRDIDCVDDIYKEFKGMGRFSESPIAGGLEECDRRWKTRWRRHFNSSDQKRFSRMSMLTKAIDYQVTTEGRLLCEVLGSFDHYFLQKKRSFCGLIALLQAEGLLQKKAPRTKRVVQGESPGEGGGGG